MRVRVTAIMIAIVIAGIALASSLLAADGYPRLRRLEAEVSRLNAERERLQREVSALHDQIAALKSGGKYRQKAIRDELGFVRDDELIVELPRSAEGP